MSRSPLRLLASSVALLSGVAVNACGSTAPKEVNSDNNNNTTIVNGCNEGAHQCEGRLLQVCEDEQWTTAETCDSDTSCENGLALDEPECGSSECNPGDLICNGTRLLECQPDHKSYLTLDTCDSEEACEAGLMSGECGTPAMGGAGTGGETPFFEELVLDTAFLNLPYTAAVISSNDSSVTVELKEGDLPAGLSLSPQGVLSGKASETGTFEVTLTVSNSDDKSESITLSIVVDRKRWLMMATTDGPSLENGLYLVDYTSPLLPEFEVSTNMSDFSSICFGGSPGATEAPQFSPDGKWLAYCADKDVENDDALYLVNVAGDAPVGDERISDFGNMGNFAWSDDSRHLAFELDGKMMVASFDGETLGAPVELGPGTSPSWLGSKYLFFRDGFEGPTYSAYDGENFTSPRTLTGPNTIFVKDAGSEQASLQEYGHGNQCLMTSVLINFATQMPYPGPVDMSAHYSPNLDWFIVQEGDSEKTWGLYNATSYAAGMPITTMPSPRCIAYWSPDSKWAAVDSEESKISLLNTETKVVSTLDITTPRFFTPDQGHSGFSPDSRWFRTSAFGSNALWIASMSGDTPGTPTKVSGENVAILSTFTPDSEGLIYYSEVDQTFYLVDLSGSSPESRQLLSEHTGDGTSQLMNVSVDSTAFAYRAKSYPASGPEDLYVVDLVAEGSTGKAVTSLLNTAGARVNFTAFQP